MIPPVISMDGNKLTSSKGEVSSVYRFIPPDIEQFSKIETESLYKDIGIAFRQLLPLDYLKICRISGSCFINTTNRELLLPSGKQSELIGEEFLETIYSNIDIKDDYFLYNGSCYRLLSVAELPTELVPNELLYLGDSAILIRRFSTVEAKKKLNLKRRMHFSSLFENIRNIEAENSYNESENLLEEVTSSSESLFEAEIFFFAKGATKEELDKNSNYLIREFSNLEGKLKIEGDALTFLLYTLCFGVAPSFKRSHLVPGEYLYNLLPYHNDFLMSEGIRFSSINGNDIKFNLFNRLAHNYNALITGSSGVGKSMLANKILKEELELGRSAVILDLGNSFSKNVKYFKGVVLSEKINPLQFKDPLYLKEFIKAVIGEKLSALEEGKLLREIKSINLENISFKELIFKLETVQPNISFYFEELYDYFSDDITNENRVTYCDFSNYPEKIKAPLIIYLIEYFKSLKGKKLFLFDECWHLLEKNGSYIAECFRTFRKFQASAIAISQNVDDFTRNELGQVILQNTFYKIMFQQKCSDKVFSTSEVLSRVEKLSSRKGEYSEFLIQYEGANKVVRYYPTPFEYELFTTDRDDLLSFEKYLRTIGDCFDFKKSLENFVLTKYPYLERNPYGY